MESLLYLDVNVVMSKLAQIRRWREGEQNLQRGVEAQRVAVFDQRRSNRYRAPNQGSCSSPIHSVCHTAHAPNEAQRLILCPNQARKDYYLL